MNDLMWVLSELTEVDGTIKIPGINEMVQPLTEEEDALYDPIDFDLEEYR